jgi:hypothetical protein
MVRNAHFDDRFYNPRDPRLYRRRVRIQSALRMVFLLAVLSCALVPALYAQADVPMGTVQGRLFPVGPDGPVQIVGAAVMLTGPIERKAETDPEGHYSFEAVPPGTYQIEAVSSGLHAQQTITVEAHKVALLPPGAIVINTARGGLIVDDDLIAALKTGRVAAAGLDVFEGEPKLNPGYVGLKNTFLTSHIGTATVESRTLMGMVALDNIDAVLTGKLAPSLVAAQTE